MIDDLKERASGYIENAGKRKDELVERAADLKNKYDENQRKKMEDWVYKKEAELIEFEKVLNQREELIRNKERKLNQKFFVRFIGVATGLSVIGFFSLASFVGMLDKDKRSETPRGDISTTKSPTPERFEFYTTKEAEVYNAYNDIDEKNPKFDVGNYCLEKEKKEDLILKSVWASQPQKLWQIINFLINTSI